MYLLHNLVEAETGKPLTNHIWVTLGFWAQGLRSGDTIAFDARISIYARDYLAQCDNVDDLAALDWRLQRPTRVEIVEQGPCPTDQVTRFGRPSGCSTKRPGRADRPQRAISGPRASSHQALTTSRLTRSDMSDQPPEDLGTAAVLLVIAVVLVGIVLAIAS
jgi:hypothetical protein